MKVESIKCCQIYLIGSSFFLIDKVKNREFLENLIIWRNMTSHVLLEFSYNVFKKFNPRNQI